MCSVSFKKEIMKLQLRHISTQSNTISPLYYIAVNRLIYIFASVSSMSSGSSCIIENSLQSNENMAQPISGTGPKKERQIL